MKNTLSRFVAFLSPLFVSASAFAESGGDSSNYGTFAIAAAIAVGLPAFAGALGQGKAAAAALEGISRNPGASGKIFVPMILCMALIESLVLFGLLMAFILSGKIG